MVYVNRNPNRPVWSSVLFHRTTMIAIVQIYLHKFYPQYLSSLKNR